MIGRAILLLALLTIAPRAYAALNVQSCSVSNSTINFGLYDPLNPRNDDNNAGLVQLSCTLTGSGNLPVVVALGLSGGTLAQRKMFNGVRSLDYNIYTSPTYATVWGDGSAGSAAQSAVLTKSTTSASWVLYGRIPAGQLSVAPGVYSDVIQVTVSW